MQNDHHRERMELEAKHLSELNRREAAHTEEITRLKNRISWQTTLSAVSVSCCSKQATSSARQYTALSVWQGIITNHALMQNRCRTSRVPLTCSVTTNSRTVQPEISCISLPSKKEIWITGSKSKPDEKSIT